MSKKAKRFSYLMWKKNEKKKKKKDLWRRVKKKMIITNPQRWKNVWNEPFVA